MRRVASGCDLTGIKGKIVSLYESMKNDKVFKDNLGDIPSAFRKIYENETRVKLEDSDFFPPTSSKLLAVAERIKKTKTLIQRGGGLGMFHRGWLSSFYNASALGKQAPALGNIVEEFIGINYEMKGRSYQTGEKFHKILKSIMREGKERGFKTGYFKNFKKKADQLEANTLRALARLKNNPEDHVRALDEWNKIYDIESKFYKEHEGQLFEEVIFHVEKNIPIAVEEYRVSFKQELKDSFIKSQVDKYGKEPTEERIESFLKGKSPSNEQIRSKIKESISNFEYPNTQGKVEKITNNVAEAVKTHVSLMEDLHKIQVKGIEQFIEGLRINLESTTNQTRIDDLASKILKRITPDERIGYYPHNVVDMNAKFMDDIMPHLERINQAASLKLTGHEEKTLGQSLEDLNTYLTGRERSRSDENDFDFSKNYLNVVKNYMDEINRFNYIAFSNTATKKAVADVNRVWNKGDGKLNGYAQEVHDFIRELHSAQTGQNMIENPQVNAALRFMLGAEFVSKLGWNIRSGLRNATQSMLNWVHFGFTANSKADKYIRENALELDIETALKGKGLFFLELAPELQETGLMARGAHKAIEVSSDGNVRFVEPGKMEVAAENLATFTQSGFGTWFSPGSIMQRVENYNRKRTFKTAYAIMHKQLGENLAWRRSMIDKGMSDAKIESSIVGRSDAFATNMVTMLHFDYSDVSKAKVLRHPLGRVIGQFQHYTFKIFEYNMNLLSGARRDVASTLKGQPAGQEALRAFRMSVIYFLGPLLAEALTEQSFSNLIENDVISRINQLAAIFTGDEEDIKKATYGRGLTAIIGGPFISDALRIGNLMGFMDLDDDSKYRFLTGYEESAFKDGDFESYEMFRTLSSSLTRVFGTNLQVALHGSGGRAAFMEAGLYPTKQAKDRKKALISGVKNVTDNSAILAALDYLEKTPKEKKTKKHVPITFYH